MSILIKGMDMPISCENCVFADGTGSFYPHTCSLNHIQLDEDFARMDCPLIEIPTPHGRLIDWDAFNNKLDIQYAEGRGKTLAPTILEEEK